jgi:PBP1b-binding outer membrane lipoprotein LpoB
MKHNFRLTALIAASALVLSGCVAVTGSETPEPVAPVASPAPPGFESFYNQIVEFE